MVLVASPARCQQCADGNGSGATCIAGGSGAGEYFNSKTLHGTTEPSWNEEFTFPVKDLANSHLECSIWDQSGAGDTPAQKFLGEVILNLAKLVPYNKSTIEQVFDIKQGKTHKATADDKKATGKLKLGLQLIIPDDAGSDPPSAPAPPQQKAQAPPPPHPPAEPELSLSRRHGRIAEEGKGAAAGSADSAGTEEEKARKAVLAIPPAVRMPIAKHPNWGAMNWIERLQLLNEAMGSGGEERAGGREARQPLSLARMDTGKIHKKVLLTLCGGVCSNLLGCRGLRMCANRTDLRKHSLWWLCVTNLPMWLCVVNIRGR